MAKPRSKADHVVSLTVTSKGQVTLRKDVLEHLGVTAGEKIEVSKLPGGRVEVRAMRPGGGVERIFGLLADPQGKHATLEEISQAIEEGWAGKR